MIISHHCSSSQDPLLPSTMHPLTLDDPRPFLSAGHAPWASLPASSWTPSPSWHCFAGPLWSLTLLTTQPALKLPFPNPQLLLVPLLFWFASLWHPFIQLLPLFNDPLLRPLGKPVSLRAPVSKVLWPLWPPWGCRMMDDGTANQIGLHSMAWPRQLPQWLDSEPNW